MQISGKFCNIWIFFFIFKWAGIETSKALLEEMRKASDKKNEGQAFLIEPLLADAVSNLRKYEIPRQLFLHSTAMGLTEPILWLFDDT